MPIHYPLIAYAVLAGIYLLTIHRLPYKGDFVVKSAPIFLLTIVAFLSDGQEGNLLLAGALWLSAGGDISLSFKGDKYFIMGLGLFLLSHIIYTALFLEAFALENIPLWVPAALGGLALGLVLLIWGKLGNMRVPVLVYIIVILAMGLAAAGNTNPGHDWLLVGAIIFMLSDAMIALDRFWRPVSGSKYFIMTTYYLAQALIFYGVLTS